MIEIKIEALNEEECKTTIKIEGKMLDIMHESLHIEEAHGKVLSDVAMMVVKELVR